MKSRLLLVFAGPIKYIHGERSTIKDFGISEMIYFK